MEKYIMLSEFNRKGLTTLAALSVNAQFAQQQYGRELYSQPMPSKTDEQYRQLCLDFKKVLDDIAEEVALLKNTLPINK